MGLRLEPVGPLPPSTYWRRRGVVLAALVVLLLLLTRSCGGSDEAGQALDTGASPTPVAVPPVTSSPPARPTTTATPTPSAAVAACAPRTGLRIAVTTDAARYPLGTTARLTMTITNSGAAPCRIGLGQGSLEFRVASGSDRIWSSDDCAPGGPAGVTTLEAGERRATSLSWSLTRSAPGCEADRPAVRPGTYVLGARVGQQFSPQHPFTVGPRG